MRSLSFYLYGALALAAALGLLAANLMLGDLNQDEGWYLYAARLVAEGHLPYRDFAFTQMPLLPFVYALVDPWVRDGGLAAGRLFTALLGLAGAGLAAGLAARLVEPGRRAAAALTAFTLALVNAYQTYYLCVVKTYALTTLCLLGGFFLLSLALERRSRPAALLAGALLTLAACTRTSAAPLVPLVAGGLWLARRQIPWAAWWSVGWGAALTGLAILGPLYALAPENFWFCAVRYHTLRHGGDLLPALVYKAGFVSRLVQAYFVACLLGAAVWLGHRLLRRKTEPGFTLDPAAWEGAAAAGAWDRLKHNETMLILIDPRAALVTRLVWAGVACVTLVHLSAPFPYDDYQVLIYPLFAAAVAAAAVRFVTRFSAEAADWLVAVVLAACVGAACSSPINQDWFIQGRDRIWWRLKDRPPLLKLRATAAELRALTKPGDLLLTQDPYLAVEAGLKLPPGMEMGQFCYFPDLSRREALRLHVLNRQLLEELLDHCPAPVAALSGYSFAMLAPQVDPVPPEDQAGFWQRVERRYEPIGTVPHFGQAATTLRLFKKKSTEPAGDWLDRVLGPSPEGAAPAAPETPKPSEPP